MAKCTHVLMLDPGTYCEKRITHDPGERHSRLSSFFFFFG